jgi:hypothetical protein
MLWFQAMLRRIGFMQKGDIKVIGLVAGTHVIEDIGRDVPHGMTVTIPVELAVRSKDLWRAISQKCLFQLPTVAAPPQYPPPDQEKPRLEARILDLEAKVRMVTAENLTLREELRRGAQDQSQKLDSILAAIQNGIPMAGVRPGRPPEEVADGTAPTFLPSRIKSDDLTAHIDIQGESSTADVAGAAERLRKMRKGEA